MPAPCMAGALTYPVRLISAGGTTRRPEVCGPGDWTGMEGACCSTVRQNDVRPAGNYEARVRRLEADNREVCGPAFFLWLPRSRAKTGRVSDAFRRGRHGCWPRNKPNTSSATAKPWTRTAPGRRLRVCAPIRTRRVFRPVAKGTWRVGADMLGNAQATAATPRLEDVDLRDILDHRDLDDFFKVWVTIYPGVCCACYTVSDNVRPCVRTVVLMRANPLLQTG
jgi:hypothetical protein